MAGVVEISGRNTTTNNPELIQVVSGAALVTIKDAAGNSIDLTHASRDVYQQWLHGSESAGVVYTVGGGAQLGIPGDIRFFNPNARQLVIINTSGTPNINYRVLQSRNGQNVATGDIYPVVGSTNSTASIISLNFNVSTTLLNGVGYDQFLFLEITPNGTDQTVRAYLTGRGG